jgi:tetratricopeptide (TPR) repeat protein
LIDVLTMGFLAPTALKAIVIATILSRGDCFYPQDATLLKNRRCGLRQNGGTAHPLFASPGRNLSAAEKERREEEKRRRERAEDVVVGKTSAISGASDYALDVDATREQWMRQATPAEQEIFQKTELGMEMLKMLRLEEASKAFDRVFELKPNAYLWQAGIARFYLDDLDGAAEIFSRCAATYESRFGEPATEERIWRNACLLKKLSSMSRKDRKLLEQSDDLDSLVTKVPATESTAELLRSERRKVFRITRDLFQSSVDKDHTATIFARAKLISVGGSFDDRPKMDKKMWKISSWFYLGLHYDALDDHEESKKCIKMALRLRPNANGSDLIHTLPMLHMTCRNWFDDEAFDYESHQTAHAAGTNLADVSEPPTNSSRVPSNADPVIIASMRSSLEKMRYVDLQEALRVKGLRAIGSKEELIARLFDSLMSDTGLMP